MSLATDFAEFAAKSGWTEVSLRAFCIDRGITGEAQKVKWPDGVRTLGHQLNAHADAGMMRRWQSGGQHSLSEVLLGRFEDNRIFKPAVRSLAVSDVFHPFDTLRRTRKTAGLMWSCQSVQPVRAGMSAEIRSWLLVVLYSMCVLVWLADGSGRQNATRIAVKLVSALLGGR